MSPGIGGAARSATARTKRGPAGSDFAGRQQGNALLNLLISPKAGGQSRGPARPARGRRRGLPGAGGEGTRLTPHGGNKAFLILPTGQRRRPDPPK